MGPPRISFAWVHTRILIGTSSVRPDAPLRICSPFYRAVRSKSLEAEPPPKEGFWYCFVALPRPGGVLTGLAKPTPKPKKSELSHQVRVCARARTAGWSVSTRHHSEPIEPPRCGKPRQ